MDHELAIVLPCVGTSYIACVDQLAAGGAPSAYCHSSISFTDCNGGLTMPVLRKLQEYLDQHGIKYQVVTHSLAYTAQEVARYQHIPGKQVAKVVMVKKQSGKSVMLVLPASFQVDFAKLRQVLGEHAELEQEKEFRVLFPGCEVGAEPPFGNLFDIDVVVDKSLAEDEEIVFNGGSHWQTVKMRYEDYERLVRPRVASFAQHL
jgi:Ala-tRNA(Pro) deacylase